MASLSAALWLYQALRTKQAYCLTAKLEAGRECAIVAKTDFTMILGKVAGSYEKLNFVRYESLKVSTVYDCL